MINEYIGKEIELEHTTPLFKEDGHEIYWLGITDNTAFRCNTYLIKDGDEFFLVDPGNRSFFQQVKSRVEQITDAKNISGIILCHQDPDVAASMVDWLDFKSDITIYSSTRANVLLPHYGKSDYNFYDIVENDLFTFKSGRQIKFIEAPFLHFPGAFTTYDITSKFLFSGDIFAALDTSWQLVVDDFEQHQDNLDLFHIDYMASNIAARGYVRRLDGLDIEAILPQHGSIIARKDIVNALEYLKNLQCGLDITYSDLS